MANATTPVIQINEGKVGIGTTTPGAKLEVQNHATTTSVADIIIDGKRTDGNNGAVGELIFSNNGDTFATVAGFRDGADNKGALQFQTQGVLGFATRMTIATEGEIILNQYTLTQQTANSVYLLGVDSTGKVVQSTNIPAGTGGSAGPFLKDTTDTFTGSLTIVGDIRGNNPLVLNVGESYAYATGQTGEILYVNSENGLQVNSSPDNWSSGWAGRDTATICGTAGVSSFPAAVTVNGNFTVNSNLAKLSGSSPFFDIVNSAETDAGIIFQDLQDSNQRQTIAFNSSDNALKFQRNNANTESMRIKSDGNVGINSTNPLSKLEVNGTINFNASGDRGFICNPGQGTFSLGDIDELGGGGYLDGNSDDMRWYNSGNVKFKVDNNGTVTASGDMIAYGSPSDKRLKENIKPIESALDKAMKLQGVTFDWKKSDSLLDIKEDIGFIAQDVQKVVPELVRENADGMLSMRHQGIAPILLEAIKELKAEIDLLKSKPCTCNKCNCNI